MRPSESRSRARASVCLVRLPKSLDAGSRSPRRRQLNGNELNGVRNDIVHHQIEVPGALHTFEVPIDDLTSKEPLKYPF